MNADRFKYKEITDIILTLDPAHEAQLINYLKATNIEVGLLLNFGRKPELKLPAASYGECARYTCSNKGNTLAV